MRFNRIVLQIYCLSEPVRTYPVVRITGDIFLSPRDISLKERTRHWRTYMSIVDMEKDSRTPLTPNFLGSTIRPTTITTLII